MKINYLQIDDWCILKNTKIHFDKKLSVLIGENGSGKSSVIEAIALIFGHLYKYFVEDNITDDFIEGYIIDYNVIVNNAEYNIFIESISHQDPNNEEGNFNHKLTVNGKEHTRNTANKIFKNIGGFKAFLPESIVLYYAGISTQLAELANHFDEKYRKALTKAGNNYTLNNLPKDRPYFYCDAKHLPLILLSLLISSKEEHKRIPKLLNIDQEGVEIDIRLKEPSWKKSTIENFWGATGTLRELIDLLNLHSFKTKFNSKEKIISIKYIGALSLRDIFDDIETSDIELYILKMFDLLLYNDLLSDIFISWKNKNKEKIELNRLSEGEKQLILTSGLISLWNQNNCLLLFDEPDTFLHPKWQAEFIPNLLNLNLKNQIIITTHSSLLVSGIKEGDILSMKNGKSKQFCLPTYGKDANTILNQAMESSVRVKEIDEKITHIETLLKEVKLEEAKIELNELSSLLNDNTNPTVIRLNSILKRKEIIGR